MTACQTMCTYETKVARLKKCSHSGSTDQMKIFSPQQVRSLRQIWEFCISE